MSAWVYTYLFHPRPGQRTAPPTLAGLLALDRGGMPDHLHSYQVVYLADQLLIGGLWLFCVAIKPFDAEIDRALVVYLHLVAVDCP